jgi:hypothetical protein
MTPTDRHPDAGDTLVEVVLALMIISICVVSLMAGLATSISGSAEHKSLSTIDTVLKSYAEAVKWQVELQSAATFTQCASVTSTSYGGTAITFSPPSGYTVALTDIAYWNTTSNQFDAVSASTCQSSAQYDARSSITGSTVKSGYQLLSLKVTAPDRVSQTMHLGVRLP